MADAPDNIEVVVNGETKRVPAGTTVAALIERLGLSQGACAAEVNRTLVPKREQSQRTLETGDTVELVSLVGGG